MAKKRKKQKGVRKKGKSTKRQLYYLITLIGGAMISILSSLLLKQKFNLSNTLSFIAFGYLFIVLIILINTIFFRNKKDNQFYLKLLVGLLTALILFGQFGIFAIQTELMEKQTEIFENSYQPYEPWIVIVPDIDDLVVSANRMSDKQQLQYNIENAWAEIDLTIYNFGKMDSQNIYCYVDGLDNKVSAYIRPNSNFEVNGSDSIGLELHIRDSECRSNQIWKCNRPELLPRGKTSVTLDCKCNGCKKQGTFNETIEFCIWHESSKECEGVID